jgi:hypothetical protein
LLTVVEGNRLVEVRLPSLSESDVKLGDVKFTWMLTAPTSETIVRQIMDK